MADADRYRVEELAALADVSVDTIRFYQKRRLLDPPDREGRIAWYGPDHRERLERIKELRRRGLTLALIGRLVRGELDATDELLAAAVVEAEQGEGNAAGLSLAEVAEQSGMPTMVLEAAVAEGLLRPRVADGEPVFSPADVDTVRAGVRILEVGLPFPDLLALARAHHEATEAIAEQAVALFDEHVRRPLREGALDDTQKAERLVEAFRVLLPNVTTLVANHFRRVLLDVAQQHLESVGHASELAAVADDPEWTAPRRTS